MQQLTSRPCPDEDAGPARQQYQGMLIGLPAFVVAVTVVRYATAQTGAVQYVVRLRVVGQIQE